MTQISMLPQLMPDEDVEDLKEQMQKAERYKKQKRKWENAFQKWCNNMNECGVNSYGCCGYGEICDWCEDNSYGRPCVRALNAMCREKRLMIDYTNWDFKRVWNGEVRTSDENRGTTV